MSSEKRFVLFIALSIVLMFGTDYVLRVTGLIPPPPRPAPAAQAEAPRGAGAGAEVQAGDVAKKDAEEPRPAVAEAEKPSVPPATKGAAIKPADPEELVLGSTDDKAPDAYHLAVQLEQRGAGVAAIASAQHDAEFKPGRPRHRPFQFLEPDFTAPPSFATTVGDARAVPAAADAPGIAPGAVPLDGQLWEVVRDKDGRAVTTGTAPNPRTGRATEFQELAFRATLERPAVVVTKSYRLWRGEDGFDLGLTFEAPSGDQAVVYRLDGPHGIPIEGEWYTSTFRDVFFGQKGVKIVTHTAGEVVKAKDDPKALSAAPLLYAGVEDQYFAVFLEPDPFPASDDESRIAETIATVVHENAAEPQKADVSVRVTSKPVQVGPDRPVTHTYRVFAGPKTAEALRPFGAEDLVSYRKYQMIPIPGASEMAYYVIAPLLVKIYALTEQVARVFGGRRGSYGIAIILLTVTVRLMMFPLSRKQAISAKKMQELQPQIAELKEKCGDDKEKFAKEQWALFSKNGVNPLGGCIPALIQLPIFVGLWQALNSTVALRHAEFLWINDLSAPDMIWKFPVTVPFLGDYLNLLPFAVVALMLVQTKLFSPPATTPEAEMQQKMMKFMMIFMAFMFYKVPSGLGIYFITSSLWAIGERLLLPKLTPATVLPPARGDDGGNRGGPGGGGKGGPGGEGKGPSGGWLSQRFEALLEEAARDRTVRNSNGKGRDRGQSKARPGKRR